MGKKNWKICINCQYMPKCFTGQNRIIGMNFDSSLHNEIGCFDYEIYLKQINDKQLKLF